ncbi:AGE family epimerase/isomerase [Rhizobium sp. CRIBSB]|nr:AGE family epimerase/isomerase [Rhizobium sp. CRIBSB]
MDQDGAARLLDARDRFFAWLRDAAYPLWWATGLDRQGAGFFEKIAADGHALSGPRRARVLGRQIYSFSQAPRLGWTGPVEAAVQHGLAALPAFLRDDGLTRPLVSDDGIPGEGRPDLYDQAFTLFGLAHALPFVADPAPLAAQAAAIRQALTNSLSHPVAGFEEASPRVLPLRANPHMHLLEAALAWEAVSDDPAWTAMADGIVELALARFIDPATGALHEFFDGDWNRMSGDLAVVEPGHQFEWGWLLLRWGILRGRADARAVATRLIAIGETHGLDPVRGVLFGELNPDLTVRDPVARLWPQTERIKAWVLTAQTCDDPAAADEAHGRAADAVEALMRYFRSDLPGSWFDRMTADGQLIEEPAPASSLYHIVCAAAVLADHA